MRWRTRLGLLIGLLFLATVGQSGVASAHPLGNFTVNRYDGIVVTTDEVQVRHVVDLAEIPTVQAIPGIDSDGDQMLGTTELRQYADTACTDVADGLHLSLDGRAAAFAVSSSAATSPEGQAGLPTLRLECELAAPVDLGEGSLPLTFRDQTDTADVGWREVTLAGDGVTLAKSSVPVDSISDELRSYPPDLLSSPSDVAEATATVTPGGPSLTRSQANSPEGVGAGLGTGFGSELLTRATSSATGPIGMTVALVIAIGVGAAHALAPGHGKSLVAFALAGRRGQGKRAAVVVGVTVTATHTVSVLVLGLVIATTSQLVPTTVYPWLGVVSGVLIVGLGIGMVRSVRNRGHVHDHDHGHSHGGGLTHSRSHPGHSHLHHPSNSGVVATLERSTGPLPANHADLPPDRRGLLVSLGVLGGLVPSPTAVVVLLATAAAGNAWFGVMLVLAFGAGMALVLSAVALLVVRAQDLVLDRLSVTPHPFVSSALSRLPTVTAFAVCIVGGALVLRSWPW